MPVPVPVLGASTEDAGETPALPEASSLESGMSDPTYRRPRTRRSFLSEMGAGFAGLALTSLLDRDGHSRCRAAASELSAGFDNPLAVRVPHFTPRAKSCIFLFMYGGPPSMDTWDYKPELEKRDGETVELTWRRHSVARASSLRRGAASVAAGSRGSGARMRSPTWRRTWMTSASSRVSTPTRSPTARR